MSFINAIFTFVNPVMTSKLLCTNIEKNDNLKKEYLIIIVCICFAQI